jgi:hypothetical protein
VVRRDGDAAILAALLDAGNAPDFFYDASKHETSGMNDTFYAF